MMKDRIVTARHADSERPHGSFVAVARERAVEARMEDCPDMMF